jgi:hypothetical protein
MSAVEALRLARESGIRLGVAGADLILDADCEPAPPVLEAIRRHKRGIVALLTRPDSEWAVEDWQAFFDERAGIAEFDHHLSRADAEARAYECCVIEWMNRNPPTQGNADRCIHCEERMPENQALPVLTGDGGHIWLHAACHSGWIARRKEQAVVALAAMGIATEARHVEGVSK